MRKRRLGRFRSGFHKRAWRRLPQVEWMEQRALLANIFWTGLAGNDNWDLPNNWNTQTVPNASDNVTINGAVNVVHSELLTDSIESLTANSPLTIAAGTLSIASVSITTAKLTISGGTLTGAGKIIADGPLTLSSGTVSGASTLYANDGILLDPAGSNFVIDGGLSTTPPGNPRPGPAPAAMSSSPTGPSLTTWALFRRKPPAHSSRAQATPGSSTTRARLPNRPAALRSRSTAVSPITSPAEQPTCKTARSA